MRSSGSGFKLRRTNNRERVRMEKVSYFGSWRNGAAQVFRSRQGHDPEQGTPISLRLDLRQHSPTRPEWGYSGSGPAQLALALLADFLGSDAEALALYQQFKAEVVARLPHAGWVLAEHQIDAALAAIGQAAPRA